MAVEVVGWFGSSSLVEAGLITPFLHIENLLFLWPNPRGAEHAADCGHQFHPIGRFKLQPHCAASRSAFDIWRAEAMTVDDH